MPIVIDEVVISIEVTRADAPCPSGYDERNALHERAGLVDECVQKVLEILRRDPDPHD